MSDLFLPTLEMMGINSPGGSVTAAEEVGRELERFKETTKKPIVTSMGDQAASAAYWLASYSDIIYANSSTLTGSIGVYMPYMNVEDLYKKNRCLYRQNQKRPA